MKSHASSPSLDLPPSCAYLKFNRFRANKKIWRATNYLEESNMKNIYHIDNMLVQFGLNSYVQLRANQIARITTEFKMDLINHITTGRLKIKVASSNMS